MTKSHREMLELFVTAAVGMRLRLDRMVMTLAGRESLRDLIPFPLTGPTTSKPQQ